MEPAEERALREKVKKRGRAYQCLACYQRLGRTYINEKLKVEDHIYRDHVRPNEVPFYCRLCTFHCQRLDQLMNHVKNYGPHQDQVRRRSIPDEGRAIPGAEQKPICDWRTGLRTTRGRREHPTLDESRQEQPEC